MKAQNCKELMVYYFLQVKLGALDATVHTVKSSQYGVQGYPTIKYFPSGKKDASSASEYNGGRTGSDIVNWALAILTENVPAPEVKQVFLFYSVQKRVVGFWKAPSWKYSRGITVTVVSLDSSTQIASQTAAVVRV
jgi:hypothetical protein